MALVIELCIFLMTGMLVVHAIVSRSPQFALLFWMAGFSMGVMRELAMSGISSLYQFNSFTLWIGNSPLVMILFWANICYIGWQWSNNFLGSEYFLQAALGSHLPLVFLTLALISFFFETLLSQTGLIRWHLDPSMPYILGHVPLLAPFSYGFTGVVFLKAFKLIWNAPRQTRSDVGLRLVVVQPIVVLVIMGLLFSTHLIFVAIFS